MEPIEVDDATWEQILVAAGELDEGPAEIVRLAVRKYLESLGFRPPSAN